MRHGLSPFPLFCHAVGCVICFAAMVMGAAATQPADPVVAVIAQTTQPSHNTIDDLTSLFHAGMTTAEVERIGA